MPETITGPKATTAAPAKRERELWADRLKGILILSVVIGHILPPPYNVLTTPASYIFLFHLPAFFIISGYTAHTEGRSFGKSLLHRTKRILVPYFIYLFAIAGGQIVWKMCHGYTTKRYLGKVVPAMLLGGQDLNQFFCGALWFMTAMFVASVLFYAVEQLIPSVPVRIGVYVIFWAAAHIEAMFFVVGTGPTPWLWDVGIICACYMAMGKYLKPLIFHKFSCLVSVVVLALLLAVRLSGISPYLNAFGIELWSHSYRHPVLDFVVPFAGFILLANLAKLIPQKYIGDFFCDLGRYTIPIMAMHQSVIQIMILNGITNPIALWIVATAVPYLLAKLLFSRIPVLKSVLI